MKVFLAGCFVFAVLLAAVAGLGALNAFDQLPSVLVGGGLSLLMLALIALSVRLFNPKGMHPLGIKSQEQQIRELEAAGLLEDLKFRAVRAFGVDELEDEGQRSSRRGPLRHPRDYYTSGRADRAAERGIR